MSRFIVTVETSKFKPFVFLDVDTIPDHKLYAVASDDAYHLACLSSAPHQVWAYRTGGRLGVGNDPTWTNTTTFKPFPFPALKEGPLKARLRDLGERLDAHHKRQQALHPHLTLTGIYNVLEKLRAGEALNAKEKQIHDDGLVTLLRQIHDEIDAAVLEAYGWGDLRSADTPVRNRESFEEELLTRLVALNHERTAEESHGLIRWLRPEYQNPAAATAPPVEEQTEIALPDAGVVDSKKKRQDAGRPSAASILLTWPDKLPAQVAQIRSLLPETGPDPAALSARFGRANQKRLEQIEGILETLRGLGL